MWDLPGPGLEPVSPALAGRFLTTVPPGKSHLLNLLMEVIPSLISLSFLNIFLKSLYCKTSFIWSEFLFWFLIWDFGLEVSVGVGGFEFSSLPPPELSLSLSVS